MKRHHGSKTNATTEESYNRSSDGRIGGHRDGLLVGTHSPRHRAATPVFVLQLLLLHSFWDRPGYLCAVTAAAASAPSFVDIIIIINNNNDDNNNNKVGGTAAELESTAAAAAAAAASGRVLESDPAMQNVDVDVGERGKEIPTEPAELFSPEWLDEYGRGDSGCELARGSFMWRGQGFGSNINSKSGGTIFRLRPSLLQMYSVRCTWRGLVSFLSRTAAG